MYYSTSGSYRKTKMIINYLTVMLTVIIGIMFILILFFRSRSGYLFPLEFLAGGILNGITGIKNMLERKRVAAIILYAITLGLLLMAYISWKVLF